MRQFGLCLLLACGLSAQAAETNLLVWDRANDRVDADVRGELVLPLLEQIAKQSGWHVFVEPDVIKQTASAKFKDLSFSDALRMLLGNVNFAIVPQTNGPTRLYVFHTSAKNATQPVRAAKAAAPRRIENQLLLRLKPGVNADALAKSLGAKITGRDDKHGIYRLEFTDAATTDAALASLKNNSDVTSVDYNYHLDPPPPAQALASAPQAPVSLQLKPPGGSGRVIVGVVDTGVQSLDPSLQKFLLKQISVAGDAPDAGSDLTHGTAMVETILRGLGIVEQGNTSVMILPVDVYGANAGTTSWDVANGIVQAVNNGATVINMSLGGTGDSSFLQSLIQQTIASGIPIFASAGNEPVSTPTYPAAYPGVIAVTAVQQGKLAPYANYGSFVDLAAPDSCVVYLGGQAWYVQGTSVSSAYMAGFAAATADATHKDWTLILQALSRSFPVPGK
jgi:hypothetical protein